MYSNVNGTVPEQVIHCSCIYTVRKAFETRLDHDCVRQPAASGIQSTVANPEEMLTSILFTPHARLVRVRTTGALAGFFPPHPVVIPTGRQLQM